MSNLSRNYANFIIDKMDVSSLLEFAVEAMEDRLLHYTDEQIAMEIVEHYDQETLNYLNK